MDHHLPKQCLHPLYDQKKNQQLFLKIFPNVQLIILFNIAHVCLQNYRFFFWYRLFKVGDMLTGGNKINGASFQNNASILLYDQEKTKKQLFLKILPNVQHVIILFKVGHFFCQITEYCLYKYMLLGFFFG